MTKAPAMIYTVGHSTHPIETFIGTLQAFRVETLVDVRTIPKSRFNPQFVRESLAESLRAAGIGYRYIKDLGGLRRAHKESLNMGWRNASFRGYADYMQTTRTFVDGLEELIAIAKQKCVAIMCEEAVPMALSPVPGRGRITGPQNRGDAHHESIQHSRSHVDFIRTG